MNIKIAKAYQNISYDASCVIAGELPIEILIGQKVRTYVNTKINNSDYDAPLEVRYWRHPADLVTIHEVKNDTIYTTEVYTDGSSRLHTTRITDTQNICCHMTTVQFL